MEYEENRNKIEPDAGIGKFRLLQCGRSPEKMGASNRRNDAELSSSQLRGSIKVVSRARSGAHIIKEAKNANFQVDSAVQDAGRMRLTTSPRPPY